MGMKTLGLWLLQLEVIIKINSEELDRRLDTLIFYYEKCCSELKEDDYSYAAGWFRGMLQGVSASKTHLADLKELDK